MKLTTADGCILLCAEVAFFAELLSVVDLLEAVASVSDV